MLKVKYLVFIIINILLLLLLLLLLVPSPKRRLCDQVGSSVIWSVWHSVCAGSLFHFPRHCGIGDFSRFISISHTVRGQFSQHIAKRLTPTW